MAKQMQHQGGGSRGASKSKKQPDMDDGKPSAAGTVLAMLDYSQQEPGILAARSGDAELERCYESDDLYESVFEEVTTDVRLTRSQKKMGVLAFIYGVTARTLAKEWDCSLSQASSILVQLEQQLLSDVSGQVLGGLRLRTEVEFVARSERRTSRLVGGVPS